MTTVLVNGWRPGFNKVQFTRLLQDAFGYSLRDAKLQTDAVMDDQSVVLQVPAGLESVLRQLDDLGAKFEQPVLVDQ